MKFIRKVTEVEKVNQLGCMGSGSKLQKQKQGPWSLGERERAQGLAMRGKEGQGMGVLQREGWGEPVCVRAPGGGGERYRCEKEHAKRLVFLLYS